MGTRALYTFKDTPTCCICNKSLAGKESYDLWLHVTTYAQEGAVIKTCEESDRSKVPNDYFVAGIDCCGPTVEAVWNAMIRTLKGEEVGRG